jgi:DNA-binding SARP family transcriptional activator
MRRLRVLGPLEVDGAAEVLGPRDRVVVSALALRPGERVDAEVLAEALWGDRPPASAAKVVHGCVSRIRKALGSEAIETVAGGYRVRSDQVDIDRQHFEDLVGRAREHLATRTPERAVSLLREALALWRGPAFGELEEWMPGRLEAVRLGQLRLAAEEDLLQARLDAGDHLGVAADGTVLTGQQPFRERRWALLALAQYRSGRQADALASIRAARRALGQELGLDPGSELVALESRILAQDAGLGADHQARLADSACPWKGLEPYGDRDGETFFGRDGDIAGCLERLEGSPLLVVTGPSGSGKSSLVRAGLIPALRQRGADVEVFTPGADGAHSMASARSRHTGDPVLVIDQFEEIFTLREAAYARPWLGEVARYALESAPVVVVVRGDHVAALGADPELARLTERGLHLVAPLAGEAVREVVEGPAKVAGLRLEPGLVDLLVRDAEGQPGALPLLSHALTETWRRREGGLLTVDGYRAAGGIRDAVAASAERLYADLSEDEQRELRWLMLHLVSLSDTGEPFRTPLAASLAAGLDDVRRRLLDLLVRARLVTSHAGGYDLAHEALVRAWPRLRAWLDEDRAGQHIRRHLAMTAAGWEALDRTDTELYRGARLSGVLDWLERGQEPLTDAERDFVEASRDAGQEEVRRLEAEARRQRVRNRRLRALVVVALVLATVAGIAGMVAVKRSQEAGERRAAAARAADRAAHEALVARSVSLRSSHVDLAALLAVSAWRDTPDKIAESAMLSSLVAQPELLGYRFLFLGDNHAAAALPGQTDILVASGSSVERLHPESGSATPGFSRRAAAIDVASELRVSADGLRAAQLLTTGVSAQCPVGCRSIVLYDVVAQRQLGDLIPVPFLARDVALSEDGSVVAAVGIGASRWDTATWDAGTGRPLARARLGAQSTAFAGSRLLVGVSRGAVLDLAPRTLRVHRSWSAPRGSTEAALVVAGSQVLAAGRSGQIALDLRDHRRLWTARVGCAAITASTAMQTAYCARDDGSVEERDLRNGQPTGRVLEPQMGIGDLLVTTGIDGSAQLLLQGSDRPLYARWRLDGPGLGGKLVAAHAVSAGGFDPSGRRILVTGEGATEVVDRSGVVGLVLPVAGQAKWLSSSAVGVMGRRPVIVSVPEGRVVPLRLPDVDRIFPGTDEFAWAVSEDGQTVRVRAFSLTNGHMRGPVLDAISDATDARVVSDSSRVLVTVRDPRYSGTASYFRTEEFPITGGSPLGSGYLQMSHLAILRGGDVLGAGDAGEFGRFGALTSRPDQTFSNLLSGISSLQVSASGERAVATIRNAVYLFDLTSGKPIGDPIPADGSKGSAGGWLSPDGAAVLVNTRDGVVMWDLRPSTMAKALCALAGRNPTYGEWSTYLGELPYAAPCPGYASADFQYPPE